jgi:hypothetical protein
LESVLVRIIVLPVFTKFWTCHKAQLFLTLWRESFNKVLKLTKTVFSSRLVSNFPRPLHDQGFNDIYRVSVEAIDFGGRSASWRCRRTPNDWRHTWWCRRVSFPLFQLCWSHLRAGWIIN